MDGRLNPYTNVYYHNVPSAPVFYHHIPLQPPPTPSSSTFLPPIPYPTAGPPASIPLAVPAVTYAYTGIARLPDEILREILSHVLHIPHDEFFAWASIRCSLRADQQEALRALRAPNAPLSHVLLVCKRFLRVGTPLLYDAVRITTQDSTKTIAEVLRTRSDVGCVVRWLRLEGGYGRELEFVAKLALNVESLYFCPDAKMRESIVGIRKALPTFNPVHLWVEKSWSKPNKHSVVLHPLLHSAIRSHWTRLVRPLNNPSNAPISRRP